MEIFRYGNEESEIVLLQMIDGHDQESMEEELEYIKTMTEGDFGMIACRVDRWNHDLSPWEAPPAFGKESFGGGAGSTLAHLEKEVLGDCKEKTIIVGGYSLAGLFALWAAYQTDIFSGVAAASPSVWFPGFTEYVRENNLMTEYVYLSLGDKEEKARNPVMARVGDSMRTIHEYYGSLKLKQLQLEWNQGNHFKDAALRTAKGFAAVMEWIKRR